MNSTGTHYKFHLSPAVNKKIQIFLTFSRKQGNHVAYLGKENKSITEVSNVGVKRN